MSGKRLTDAELAHVKRSRADARASLACEGMILTPEDERFFDQMDAERLDEAARIERITARIRQKQEQPARPMVHAIG